MKVPNETSCMYINDQYCECYSDPNLGSPFLKNSNMHNFERSILTNFQILTIQNWSKFQNSNVHFLQIAKIEQFQMSKIHKI